MLPLPWMNQKAFMNELLNKLSGGDIRSDGRSDEVIERRQDNGS